VQEVAIPDVERPLVEPDRENRSLGGEFPVQRLLKVVEHAEGTAVYLQPSLCGGARVPGEVGLGCAAELERHVADGEVCRAQQF